ESIERNKISVSDGSITKTISLGVSEFPKDTDNFWQAIEYADAALYLAKEMGRNRAVKFSEEMRSEKQTNLT
ncbi:MAG: diguanylate cyclase, partial [Nitrospira sp.]|nr:diguanylate cyclase [Nitrospira sp.]